MGLLDKTVISLFLITALSNSAYAIIAPFLPFEFESKGVSQSNVGYVFSIYSVAVVISSPLIGKLIIRYGRRPMITLGIFLMGISFIFFSLIDFIEDKRLYVSAALGIRFL